MLRREALNPEERTGLTARHAKASSPLDHRRAGVLLHPTSLPSDAPIGNLGAEAYRFIDFLKAAGMTVWQVLPLGPTVPMGSPYQCESAHAGNVWLIDLQALAACGWLNGDVAPPPDCESWITWHVDQLRQAREGFLVHADLGDRRAFEDFCAHNHHWLEDYALFRALSHEHRGLPWWDWEPELRGRDAATLAATRERLDEVLDQHRFEQFLFYRQWSALKSYANERDILLFGDMPIFVAHNSADVWAEPQYFDLDEQGQPRHVAGVPPDYFSATGQRWGNPLYVWDAMRADGFRWWERRLRTMETQFDLIRVDHFRGFQAYWSIPATEETAINGHWVEAPGDELFTRLRERLGDLPLVAEDLGIITPEVEALRDAYGLPGMKILQFAFDGSPDNPYLPDHHVENGVIYTGTHDNDTSLGWFESLDAKSQAYVRDFLGEPEEPMPWPLIRAALASVARLAMMPLQDLLELDGRYRMNVPGTESDNWNWRFGWDQVPDELATRMRHLLELYDRL